MQGPRARREGAGWLFAVVIGSRWCAVEASIPRETGRASGPEPHPVAAFGRGDPPQKWGEKQEASCGARGTSARSDPVLRRHRRPVAGRLWPTSSACRCARLARHPTLIGQGAAIDGEAGIGSSCAPASYWPPLNVSDEEIEALVLGLPWSRTQRRTFRRAAVDALAKVRRCCRKICRADRGHRAAGGARRRGEVGRLKPVPRRIRDEHRLCCTMSTRRRRDGARDLADRDRLLKRAEVIAAWCELRGDYRHFRTDRIARCARPASAIRAAGAPLMKEWREAGDRGADLARSPG